MRFSSVRIEFVCRIAGNIAFSVFDKKMSILTCDIAVDSTKSSDFPNPLQFKQLGRDKSLDSQSKEVLEQKLPGGRYAAKSEECQFRGSRETCEWGTGLRLREFAEVTGV